MTNEELQEIIAAVLSAIRENSAQITDLTEVVAVPEDSYIELSGGRKISADNLRQEIQDAILERAVSPEMSAERTERENADDALSASIETLRTAVGGKLDKTDIVEASGNSATKVMSQGYVSMMLNALGVRVGKIRVALGTNSADGVVILFTNDMGQTTSLTLPGASVSEAGVMTAADKAKLQGLDRDVTDLIDARITGTSIESGAESATIRLATGKAAHEIEIPKAGSVPVGEENPVAGVMSAQQARDLEDVVLEVFPLKVAVVSSNAGSYEKGEEVIPSVTLSITRRGVDVTAEATITTPMVVDGNILSYEAIAENTSFNVSVAHRGATISVSQLQYRFFNYVYGDILDAMPEDIVSAISASGSLRELSGRTTYSGTLAANKMFLFAVPGNISLFCRHTETGAAISGCTTGMALVPRQCDPSTKDYYSYIIVPSSDVAWNFKITNS